MEQKREDRREKTEDRRQRAVEAVRRRADKAFRCIFCLLSSWVIGRDQCSSASKPLRRWFSRRFPDYLTHSSGFTRHRTARSIRCRSVGGSFGESPILPSPGAK